MRQIDYLLIGHITRDLTPAGAVLGGTASYATRTAQALGLRVGIVTSAQEGEPLLSRLHVAKADLVCLPAPSTTTFTNQYLDGRRRQILSARALPITAQDVPPAWTRTPIVHLGPVAAEIDPGLAGHFPGTFVGLTPQGCLRRWDARGVVSFNPWASAPTALPRASAVVLSIEDLQSDQGQIDAYARWARLLAVTRGRDGADLYIQGRLHHVPTRTVEEVDPTGAGDIFATVFFAYLHQHPSDPISAARLAAYLATTSVSRPGLSGTPMPEEVAEAIGTLGLKE
jgi:sugar/nucleoside kinase (ribokinase family)